MRSESANGKMRVFLSGVMFDVECDGRTRGYPSLCQGRLCRVQEAMSVENPIHEFGPNLRAEMQMIGVQSCAVGAR